MYGTSEEYEEHADRGAVEARDALERMFDATSADDPHLLGMVAITEAILALKAELRAVSAHIEEVKR